MSTFTEICDDCGDPATLDMGNDRVEWDTLTGRAWCGACVAGLVRRFGHLSDEELVEQIKTLEGWKKQKPIWPFFYNEAGEYTGVRREDVEADTPEVHRGKIKRDDTIGWLHWLVRVRLSEDKRHEVLQSFNTSVKVAS